MKQLAKTTLCLLLTHALFTTAAALPLTLSPIFSDGGVLQRNKSNAIWGTGEAGAALTLTFQGKTYQTRVAADANWRIQTEALQQSATPSTLQVVSGKEQIILQQILVGDVWLCSGQSNMEFAVANFPWAEQEKEVANNSLIHFYTLPNTIDLLPSNTLPVSRWKTAVGADLLPLSATAYFFAKNLQPEIGVPVGLIVSDWSGTAIEPWMSTRALSDLPPFQTTIKKLNANKLTKDEVESLLQQKIAGDWGKNFYLKGEGIREKWYLPETDFSNWTPIKLPNYWQDAQVGLDHFHGAVWFQTAFDLPPHFNDSTFHIFLNYVKDYSMVWVNGHLIGEVYGDKNWNDFYVPTNYLKATGNILVARVFNIEGKGGLNYDKLWESETLAGKWVCKADYEIDPATFPKPQIVNVNTFSHPAIIYNAMISPLQNYALRGIIWYQGESNAGRGYEYRTLLPRMITDWREQFAQGDLPFYGVQLANFGPQARLPEASDWAELRESQSQALSLHSTGMAVAIDLGDSADIHPHNKQEVGRRLALLALNKTYKKRIEAESPRYKSVRFNSNSASITVISASPLQQANQEIPIRGFALAGADSIFHWADDVKLNGKRITVSSQKVPNPIAVRYAWAKNPGQLNIVNSANLPLAPFRTDRWRGVTDDRIFDENIVYF